MYAELAAARFAFGAIGLFPLETSLKIGASFAAALGRLIKRLNFVGHRNLELALPELSASQHEKILDGCFASLGRQLGLVSHFKNFTPEDVRNLLDVEGKENFDKAHAGGKGVLFFTGHFGSWEIFNLVPPAFGHTMSILVRRIDNPLVENFMENLRTRFGCRTIDKKTSARAMFRLLQSGEILGIVADLNMQEREGIFVDFFGIPASTTTSVARLALRTEAVVLPAFAIWQQDKKKYLMKVCAPIEIPAGGDTPENVAIVTQSVTNKIEEFVRKYPEQWMWIHKRWNTRPSGEPNLYAKDFKSQKSKIKGQMSEVRGQNPSSEIESPKNLESQT